MRGYHWFFVFLVAAPLLLHAESRSVPATIDLPLVDGKPTLATINGEPLTLEEFDRVLAEIHGAMTNNVARSKTDSSELLERLINARLVLQEARNIGLDELPEVQVAVETFGEETLRKILYGYQVRNIRKPDRKEVDKLYRDSVKEVKVTSLFFEKEEDAKRMEAEIKSGGKFEALVKKRIEVGGVKGSVEGQYLKFASLSPEVAKTVSVMKKGEVSPLIRIGNHFALLKLQDIRYPENKDAREQAEKDALLAKRTAVLQKYTEDLRKKNVRVDKKLLDRIDYEAAEPGIDKLREDQRVLASVKGEVPVTVADLTKALERKFFHGTERAAEKKKINKRKDLVLEEILNRRVILKEGKSRNIDKTEFYKQTVEEYKNGILFGTFVQKVVAPDVTVEENDLKTYYESHRAEFTYPEMVRFDGLAFSAYRDAEKAIEKLRKGADFQWVRVNAEGQIDKKKGLDLLQFAGKTMEVSTLPEGVRNTLYGAGPGEFRLYADSGRVYYVLHIQDRIPSKPIPLESVKGIIEKKVYDDKLQRSLSDWEEKLREASDVKIFAASDQLDRIVNPESR